METSLFFLYHLFAKFLVVMDWMSYPKVTDILVLICKCRNNKKRIFEEFGKEVWLDLS